MRVGAMGLTREALSASALVSMKADLAVDFGLIISPLAVGNRTASITASYINLNSSGGDGVKSGLVDGNTGTSGSSGWWGSSLVVGQAQIHFDFKIPVIVPARVLILE